MLPATEAQATTCSTRNLGPSEYAVCCADPDSGTLYYYGTELGCSYSAVCG
jgi:hypothetical protein